LPYPIRLVFAAGLLSRPGEMAGQYGRRALLVTGGGGVKRNGALDRALKSLKDAGISVYECEGGGAEPQEYIGETRRPASR